MTIAAGGTAGHVVPALAVAEQLRAQGAQVSFVGGERAEAELVPAAGFPFHAISVSGLSRSNPLAALRALLRAARAFLRARALLGRLDADVVMGGGGYVSGPVGLAAVTRRIPLVLTEADSHLGLANRALAPFARRVCLAFEPAAVAADDVSPAAASGEHVSRRRCRRLRARGGRGQGPGASSRYLVTGRPVPPPQTDRAGARARLGIDAEETCVLVFGGSLGARSINLAAVEAFAGAAFHVLHVCGRRDHPELSRRELPAGYDLREYLDLERVRRRARRGGPRDRARRGLDLRDRRARAPGDPDPVSARRGGSPDLQRALDAARGRRGSGRRRRADRLAARARDRRAARRPTASAFDGCGLGAAGPPACGARGRARAAGGGAAVSVARSEFRGVAAVCVARSEFRGAAAVCVARSEFRGAAAVCVARSEFRGAAAVCVARSEFRGAAAVSVARSEPRGAAAKCASTRGARR